MGSLIADAADKLRADLGAGDLRASSRMVQSYGQAWRSIQPQLEAVTRRIAEAQAAGTPVSPAWLYQEARYTNLLADLEEGLRKFVGDADLAAQQAQADAINAALGFAHAAIEAGLEDPGAVVGTFTKLQPAQLTDLIGYMGNGSPLRDVFASMPQQASQALQRALVEGAAQGLSPRQLVRNVRGELGSQLTRSLTIARTESARAQRSATLRQYQEADDVVRGWVWLSAHDARSCAACWAMHGRMFPLTETLDGHPNCRCAAAPITRSYSGIVGQPGMADSTLEVPTGEELFRQLPPADRARILGPGKARAYDAGELELGDFVGRRDDARWGTTRSERSLRSARLEKANGVDTRRHRLGPGLGPEPPVVAPPPKPPRKPRTRKPKAEPEAGVPTPAKVSDRPKWAQDVDEALAELPADRARIGMRQETLSAAERRQLEQEIADTRQLLEGPRYQPGGNGYRFRASTERRLEQLQGELDAGVRWVNDLDANGRPGIATLRQEAAVRRAGEHLHLEAQRRADAILEPLPDVGPLKARDRELWDRYRELREEYASSATSVRGLSQEERWAMRDRLKPLQDEIDAIGQERRLIARELAGARYEADRRYRDAMQEVLAEYRPMGGKLLMRKPSRGQLVDSLNSATERYYPTAWVDASNARGGATAKKVARGYQSEGPGGDFTIAMSYNDPTRIIGDNEGQRIALHEVGHRMQATIPGMSRLEWTWLNRRTSAVLPDGSLGAREPLRSLSTLVKGSGYGRDEKARADKFLDPYIGKEYSMGSPTAPTEVFTMGMESLFSASRNIHDDPDMRNLIVGMLAGL